MRKKKRTMAYKVEEVLPGLWCVDLCVGGHWDYIGAFVVVSNNTAALIETGPTSTANDFLEALKEIGVKNENVKYIIPTHIHLDHGGATGTLLKYLPNARAFIHKRGILHIINPESKLWASSKMVLGKEAEIFGKPEPVLKERIVPIEDRMTIEIGKFSLEAIPTPGHASHHISFFLYPDKVLFVGDAAGMYVHRLDILFPTTPPPFRADPALESLSKLIALNPKLNAYTHFGIWGNAVANLRKHYDQILIWVKRVKEALSRNIKEEEKIVDFIARRDGDLKKLLESSDEFNVFKRAILVSLRGFLDLTGGR